MENSYNSSEQDSYIQEAKTKSVNVLNPREMMETAAWMKAYEEIEEDLRRKGMKDGVVKKILRSIWKGKKRMARKGLITDLKNEILEQWNESPGLWDEDIKKYYAKADDRVNSNLLLDSEKEVFQFEEEDYQTFKSFILSESSDEVDQASAKVVDIVCTQNPDLDRARVKDHLFSSRDRIKQEFKALEVKQKAYAEGKQKAYDEMGIDNMAQRALDKLLKTQFDTFTFQLNLANVKHIQFDGQKKTASEKIVDAVQKTPVLNKVVNPGTITAATAITLGITQKFGHVIPIAGAAALGGTFALIRDKQESLDKFYQLSRRDALGQETDLSTDGKRAQTEKFQALDVKKMPAKHLLVHLQRSGLTRENVDSDALNAAAEYFARKDVEELTEKNLFQESYKYDKEILAAIKKLFGSEKNFRRWHGTLIFKKTENLAQEVEESQEKIMKEINKEALKTGGKAVFLTAGIGAAAHYAQDVVEAVKDVVSPTDPEWIPSEKTTEIFSDDGKQSIVVPDNLNDAGNDLLKKMMEDGSLSSEELQSLESAGWNVSKELTGDIQTLQLSEELDDVTRDFWYDNGTKKIDYTELMTHWAKGEEGNFTISAMLDKVATSSHGESIKISTENVKAFLVPNGDSGKALAIDINPDGTLNLTDALREEMFSKENGGWVFHGKHLEIAEVVDSNDGVTHIRPVSTVVGEGDMGDVAIGSIDDRGEAITLVPPAIEAEHIVPEYVSFATMFNKYKNLGAIKKDEHSDDTKTTKTPEGPIDPSVVVVADEKEKTQRETMQKERMEKLMEQILAKQSYILWLNEQIDGIFISRKKRKKLEKEREEIRKARDEAQAEYDRLKLETYIVETPKSQEQPIDIKAEQTPFSNTEGTPETPVEESPTETYTYTYNGDNSNIYGDGFTSTFSSDVSKNEAEGGTISEEKPVEDEPEKKPEEKPVEKPEAEPEEEPVEKPENPEKGKAFEKLFKESLDEFTSIWREDLKKRKSDIKFVRGSKILDKDMENLLFKQEDTIRKIRNNKVYVFPGKFNEIINLLASEEQGQAVLKRQNKNEPIQTLLENLYSECDSLNDFPGIEKIQKKIDLLLQKIIDTNDDIRILMDESIINTENVSKGTSGLVDNVLSNKPIEIDEQEEEQVQKEGEDMEFLDAIHDISGFSSSENKENASDEKLEILDSNENNEPEDNNHVVEPQNDKDTTENYSDISLQDEDIILKSQEDLADTTLSEDSEIQDIEKKLNDLVKKEEEWKQKEGEMAVFMESPYAQEIESLRDKLSNLRNKHNDSSFDEVALEETTPPLESESEPVSFESDFEQEPQETLYAAQIQNSENGLPCFDEERLSSGHNKYFPVQIRVFDSENADFGVSFMDNDFNILNQDISHWKQVFETPGYKYMTKDTITSIDLVKPGKLRKEGNKWVLVKKGVIQFSY